MAIQNLNLGVAPTGAGGDTFRSAAAKINENFTNNAHAASRLVGVAAGNVMGVGAFGLGGNAITYSGGAGNFIPHHRSLSGFFFNNTDNVSIGAKTLPPYCSYVASSQSGGGFFSVGASVTNNKCFIVRGGTEPHTIYPTAIHYLLHDGNTTTDSNGFIKAASPIVQLYADKIELNDEAAEQDITFEKVGVGHYLIKGSSGFANQGWWIEVPTDSNANKICAVKYQTLENGDLEIKTFKKKLNKEGDIVANLDMPIDIPSNSNGEPRWIDIRLNEIKKTIIHKIPRTEKQAKMVQQIKYAPQLVYIMLAEDMVDDDGKVVVVNQEVQKVRKPHIQTDANGTPILADQPVMNQNGEPVFEWVQAIDSEGNPIFEDVPVLNANGEQIIDEVIDDPEQ